MVRTIVKRKANPVVVQRLWQAIRYIRSQKQVANIKRVTSHLQREHEMRTADIEEQLQYAVDDGLIMSYKAVAQKGSNVGLEQDGYRIAILDEDELSNKGTHDWYCFNCHKPGEVMECSECWRVFHTTCVDDDPIPDDVFVCSLCKDAKKQSRIKRRELNRLLGFTIIRLKDKSKELHNFGGHMEGSNRFVYHYVDLNTMEDRAVKRRYKYLEQFYADARTILHDIFICYGDNGLIPTLAHIMIRDCRYDLDEIRQCKDCYHHSNAKPKNWFCQPCRPSHDLVFAKQKGFSYWPAKVIKIMQDGYDVRFFGSLHQRATIPPSSIKPIDVNLKQLTPKRTIGFTKAMKELSLHQDLLRNMTQDTDEQSGADNDLDEEQEKEEVMEKPVKVHHKKFHKRHRGDDYGCDSSGLKPSANRSQGVLEDSFLVSSSEDQVHGTPRVFSTTDIGVQTSKKGGRQQHRSTQTEEVEVKNEGGACNCEIKFSHAIEEYKDQLESKHKEDKARAVKELEERLRKDYEEEKQIALGRAQVTAQRDAENVKLQTEVKCKDEYIEEAKKLTEKHKREISLAKKKQWCYNCEEEAMYHCCWNTSYCSIKCQQEHWHHEHKRMCRRKRN